jgi:hypothetical protein
MSDKASTNTLADDSSDISFEDGSICEEINQLIDRCEGLHEHIHNSFQTLDNIHSMILNHTNINVKYDTWIGDFEELLEEFHSKALANIKEKGENNFGELLLNALEVVEFLS